MNRNCLFIFSLSLIAGVSNSFGSLINFQSGAVTALQPDGSTSLSAEPEGTYNFALGTFDENVLLSGISQWESAFTNEMTGTNVWKTTGPGPLQNRFQGERSMDDNSSAGEFAYIFGSSSDSSEIIFFRNSSWVFPTFDALDTTADIFSLQDSNTEVLGSNGTWNAFSGSFTMIAVPEPSTYAALAGLCALAWVAVRRRK